LLKSKITIDSVEYEIFQADNGRVEIYNTKKPVEGFMFSDIKRFVLFINKITDIGEELLERSFKEN